MGTKELKNSFNNEAAPTAMATKAYLTYEPVNGKEWQFIRFDGTWQDGIPFSIKSGPIAAQMNMDLAARTVAQTLLKQRGPKNA